MKMKYSLALMTFAILSRCSVKENKSASQAQTTGDNPIAVDSSSGPVYTALPLDEYQLMYDIRSYVTTSANASETETMAATCAILIYPTQEQIEEMKQRMGDEDFYIAADDNNWYQGKAIGLLDSLNIKIVTAKTRYLMLKGDNKTWILDLRKENLPSWNLIFFHRTKKPKVVSTVDLDFGQVQEYFARGK
jgi:hypothetical protein